MILSGWLTGSADQHNSGTVTAQGVSGMSTLHRFPATVHIR
jgi:hypothetical protein